MHVSEMVFVGALEFLRERYTEYYNRLLVPEKWKIGATVFLPILFREFLSEQCQLGDYETVTEDDSNDFWTFKPDLLKSFNSWLKNEGYEETTQNRVTKLVNLCDQIAVRRRRFYGKPYRVYAGVKLKR